MKKVVRKSLSMLLAGVVCFGGLSACSPSSKEASGTEAKGQEVSKDGQVEITFATSWVGVSSSKEWFHNRLDAFNKEYGNEIKVNVEER